MIVFNTGSWHFKLVMYVFGNNFFTEQDYIDLDKYDKGGEIVWTRKPKVVNFCPYCRAVVGAAWMIPFVFVWRLFPHKEKKQLTRGQIMRRMKIRQMIILSIAGGLNIALGVSKIPEGEYQIGILQIGLGVGLIIGFLYGGKLVPYFSRFLDFVVKHWPKKKEKPEKIKNPSFLRTYLGTYLNTKHHKICPPVAFIDQNDTNVRI